MAYYECGTTAFAWTTWTSTSSYAGTSATASTAWDGWVQTYYTAVDRTAVTAATGTTVWSTWVDRTVYTTAPQVPTEQQRVEAAAAEAKRKEKEAKRKEKEAAKEAKAKAMLELVLDEHQKKELKETRSFKVKSEKGNVYQITQGHCQNIQKLDDKTGKPIERLCFHSKEYLHDFDHMALQKLALEAHEDEARRTANITRLAA